MDILLSLTNARTRLWRRWYYFKAKRIHKRNQTLWDAMTTEQQIERQQRFAEFADAVNNMGAIMGHRHEP